MNASFRYVIYNLSSLIYVYINFITNATLNYDYIITIVLTNVDYTHTI